MPAKPSRLGRGMMMGMHERFILGSGDGLVVVAVGIVYCLGIKLYYDGFVFVRYLMSFWAVACFHVLCLVFYSMRLERLWLRYHSRWSGFTVFEE